MLSIFLLAHWLGGKDNGHKKSSRLSSLALWHRDVNKILRLASPTTVNIEDARGLTPLHLACSRSNSLAFNTHQEFPREFATSALPKPGMSMFPCRFRESESRAVEICRPLVAAGADVNAKTLSGNWLPLHNATNTGWLDLVHFLLEKGSITFVEHGCSPFCWAEDGSTFWEQKNKKDEISKLLKFHLSDEQMELEHLKHSRAFAI
ncbi:uncharacterized protein B0J16DRAFT_322513 [Fusarium flagelliforme]|uniref:uncharacterized protein n=1 Tax=Fusarium flagelliforme TaxID=2675880 RepID=UPI001E8D6845|nr:uncharacterized protein B0J16DRAFT_322513 [Fusarium flagelliforme]KAH7179025.1 hypothetical protein B0J16DRAFT_322513 [Fusarium flagelliforme]